MAIPSKLVKIVNQLHILVVPLISLGTAILVSSTALSGAQDEEREGAGNGQTVSVSSDDPVVSSTMALRVSVGLPFLNDWKVSGLIDMENGEGHEILPHIPLLPVYLFKTPRYGYVDRSGKWAIKPKFCEAQGFSEGLAAVRVDRKGWHFYGYIDKQGRWAIQPQFYHAWPFSDGVAWVSVFDKQAYKEKGYFTSKGMGVIDKTGKLIIEPRRYSVFPTSKNQFSEGLAAMSPADDPNYGYIDKLGNWVISPQFVRAEPFSGGVARVQRSYDGPRIYIDKTGKEVAEK